MIDLNSILALFEEIKQLILDLIKLVGKREATSVSTNMDEINSIKEEVLNSNNAVVETLERIEENIAQPRKEENRVVHSINPKSLGFVIPFVLLLIFWGSTLVFMYNLKFDMERMSDNDLKYRYIKMRGGIDTDNINTLEKKFYPTRDRYWIKEIQNKIEKYEETIMEEAVNIINARMKQEEAKRLQKQVDGLGL